MRPTCPAEIGRTSGSSRQCTACGVLSTWKREERRIAAHPPHTFGATLQVLAREARGQRGGVSVHIGIEELLLLLLGGGLAAGLAWLVMRFQRQLLPELATALAGVVATLAAAYCLHRLWYGVMVGDLHDEPGYLVLAPFGRAAPYAVAGLVAGLIFGVGSPTIQSVLVRSLGLVAAGLMLAAGDPSQVTGAFAPAAAVVFVLLNSLLALQQRLAVRWRVGTRGD